MSNTLFGKLGIEVLYDGSNSQYLQFAKLGIDTLYRYTTPQYLMFAKLGIDTLYRYTTPQYLLFAKLGVDILYRYNIPQNLYLCKIGAEILAGNSIVESVYFCKIGAEILTTEDNPDYSSQIEPSDNYFDMSFPYTKEINLFLPDLTEDTTEDDYIAINFNLENGSDLFDQMQTIDQTDDFTNTDGTTSYSVNEADVSSMYIDPAQCLVIYAYAHRYAHMEIGGPEQVNFEITAKIKITANSGDSQAPGIGVQQNSDNCVKFENNYTYSNKSMRYVRNGVYASIVGTTASGATTYIQYKIVADDYHLIFLTSTDSVTQTEFTRIDRHDGFTGIPTKLMFGKGAYNPSGGYAGLHQDNNYSSAGSLGYSYISNIKVHSYSNGKDLVFTLDDKVTSLIYEASYQSPKDNTGYVIVNVPKIYANKINKYYVYYGNKKYFWRYAYNRMQNQVKSYNLAVWRFTTTGGSAVPVCIDFANINHGTISGTNLITNLGTAVMSQGYIFDGSTSYITIPHNSNLNIGTSKVRYFEFIIKCSPGCGGFIISKVGTTTYADRYGFQIKLATSGRLSTYIKHENGTDGTTIHESFYDSTYLSDGGFHVVEVLVDRNKDHCEYWYDGTYVTVEFSGPSLSSKSAINLNSDKALYIGCDQTNLNLFNGIIGHFRYATKPRVYGYLAPSSQMHIEVKTQNSFYNLNVPLIIKPTSGSQDSITKFPTQYQIVYTI